MNEPRDPWDLEDFRGFVLAANADGINLLRRGQKDAAFEQLKFAESVLVANPEASAVDGNQMLALTLNNLGCYYKQQGLPRASLCYLQRAQQAEALSGRVVQGVAPPQQIVSAKASLAATRLNTCVALSKIGRHDEAESLAEEAACILSSSSNGQQPRLTPEGVRRLLPLDHEECSLLAVACHNLGAEREHLGRFAQAGVAYRQGLEAAQKALGFGSPLARTLEKCLSKSMEKASRHPNFPGIRPRSTCSGRRSAMASPALRVPSSRPSSQRSGRCSVQVPEIKIRGQSDTLGRVAENRSVSVSGGLETGPTSNNGSLGDPGDFDLSGISAVHSNFDGLGSPDRLQRPSSRQG